MPPKPEDHPLLQAFKHSAAHFPYYQTLLAEKGIEVSAIQTLEDFFHLVPVITKADVFSRFPLQALMPDGVVPDFATAILSSGTSGEFSFSLITEAARAKQKQMLDYMLGQFFQAETSPPLIINALPMGVSFVSSYPVLPVATRTDIALKAIELFGNERQIILITDPHVLKQLLEQGVQKGMKWDSYRLSAIVGGTWFSDSLAVYLQGLLSGGQVNDASATNYLFATMGVTEVGLNILAATPDLVAARHVLQINQAAREAVFGRALSAAPAVYYHMSPAVFIEVVEPDEHGVGDLVLTHLDTTENTMLVRYATGDKAKLIDTAVLAKFAPLPLLPLPVVAVLGRESDVSAEEPTPAAIKQELFSDAVRAGQVTGHFYRDPVTPNKVLVQLKPRETTVNQVDSDVFTYEGVPYREFERNVELSFDYKWKHL